jgi:outer membrane protein OmpA-like peptidoglycan-associated protein
MPRPTRLAAVLVSTALLASACTGGGPGASPTTTSSSGASGSATGSPSTSAAAPALSGADGFKRLDALPDPLATTVFTDTTANPATSARVEVVSLTKVGSVVRAIIGWDAPTSGDVAPPSRLRSPEKGATPYEIGLKLYDAADGTMLLPLRTASGDCLCSSNTGRFTDADKQTLYWADFPAPQTPNVTLLLGEQVPPIENLPVSDAAAPLDLTRAGDLVDWGDSTPPAVIGQGAAAPSVLDVRRSVQGFGGAEDSQVGQNADVSLPSDVLFAFDSATLTPAAQQVLASAVPKLAVAAKGQRVQVVGHTDDQGTPAYNQSLSLRRAQAVVAALAPRLRSASISLTAVGKGEAQHLVPNTDSSGHPIEANRQRNRRVSFVFPRARGGATVDIGAAKPLPVMPLARRTTASPLVTGSLASVLSTDGTARIDVTRVQRQGSDVWLRLAFTAARAPTQWDDTTPLLGPNPYSTNKTLANIRVVDAARRTVSVPLGFGAGQCVCSENQGQGTLYTAPLLMWAVFPAPVEGTSKVTLRIPGAGQVVDVPIS